MIDYGITGVFQTPHFSHFDKPPVFAVSLLFSEHYNTPTFRCIVQEASGSLPGGYLFYHSRNQFSSIEDLHENERTLLEQQFFKASIDEVWQSTIAYFQERDATQLELAESSPKHKMALLFSRI